MSNWQKKLGLDQNVPPVIPPDQIEKVVDATGRKRQRNVELGTEITRKERNLQDEIAQQEQPKQASWQQKLGVIELDVPPKSVEEIQQTKEETERMRQKIVELDAELAERKRRYQETIDRYEQQKLGVDEPQ